MLELKKVSKVYDNESGQKISGLNSIDLLLPRSGFVFITGASGSGKTTLLNVLALLDNPTHGEMLIEGVYLQNFTESALSAYRTNSSAVIYQEHNMIDHLTLWQNVALGIEIQGKKPSGEEITKLFEKLGIAGLEKRFPHEVSGGQLQRAAIARVLIRKPKIIFSDELTSNLDEKNRDEIYKILKDFSKDILIIATSHNKNVIKGLADRIIELDNGKISNDTIINDRPSNVNDSNEIGFVYESTQMLLKSSISLAFKNFKINKLRTIFTILLSVFAITFFAISLNLSMLTHNRAIISSFLESNSSYITLRDSSRAFTSSDRDRFIRYGDSADDIFSQTALLHQVSPNIVANMTAGLDTHNIFNIRYLAILEDSSNDLQNRNKFGQVLLYGNWPVTNVTLPNQNRIVISDFMATQIRMVTGQDLANQINTTILLGDSGHELQYQIIGIYRTNFSDYFIMENNGNFARFAGTTRLAIDAPATFSADSMLRLRNDLSTQDISRAIYLVQNNWVTAFTSAATIQNIRAGTSGIHQTSANEIKIQPFSNSNFFITDHVAGLRPIFSPLYDTIQANGLILRRGTHTMGHAYISTHLRDTADIITSSLPFVVSHEIRDDRFFYQNLTNSFDWNFNTTIAYNVVARFEGENVLGISDMPSTPETLTENIIMLSPEDFAALVDLLFIPSNSMIVSGNYSLSQISTIIDNMGDNVKATFGDSDSIMAFMNSFEPAISVMMPIAIVLATLAVLIIVGYTGIAIRAKRKMVAILRSLGAKRGDIYKIFMFESLILSSFILLGTALFMFMGMFFGNMIATSTSGHTLSIFRQSFGFYSIVLGATLGIILLSYNAFFFWYLKIKDRGVVKSMRVGGEK